MAGGSSGSNKMRKVGRNKDTCKAYASSKRREKNKLKTLKKHVIRHPNDNSALAAIENLKLQGIIKTT